MIAACWGLLQLAAPFCASPTRHVTPHLDCIWRVDLHRRLVLHQRRVLAQAEHLAEEGDGLLQGGRAGKAAMWRQVRRARCRVLLLSLLLIQCRLYLAAGIAEQHMQMPKQWQTADALICSAPDKQPATTHGAGSCAGCRRRPRAWPRICGLPMLHW